MAEQPGSARRRTEIRVTGLGGQGVVLSAHIIGRAAVDAGLYPTMMQSFGPEARGSACTATLVVSDGEVLYPYVRHPNVLVAMSGEGYEKYRTELDDHAVLLYEQDLVDPDPQAVGSAHGVPATRIAESLGRRLVQNIVMVGFFAGMIDLIPPETLRAAVAASVPAGTEELNGMAFEEGLQYAGRMAEAGASAPGPPVG